jgi:hypothetical protein
MKISKLFLLPFILSHQKRGELIKRNWIEEKITLTNNARYSLDRPKEKKVESIFSHDTFHNENRNGEGNIRKQ